MDSLPSKSVGAKISLVSVWFVAPFCFSSLPTLFLIVALAFIAKQRFKGCGFDSQFNELTKTIVVSLSLLFAGSLLMHLHLYAAYLAWFGHIYLIYKAVKELVDLCLVNLPVWAKRVIVVVVLMLIAAVLIVRMLPHT